MTKYTNEKDEKKILGLTNQIIWQQYEREREKRRKIKNGKIDDDKSTRLTNHEFFISFFFVIIILPFFLSNFNFSIFFFLIFVT